MGSRPSYYHDENEVTWVLGQLKQMRSQKKGLRMKGGGWWWVGGEFLVRDGEPIWCHRMKTYRDHVEMDVIKKLLTAE
jgi:hypothetical protein